MTLGDVIAEPLGNTGKGVVKGGKTGAKVGGIAGAIGAVLATSLFSGGLALVAVFASGAVAAAAAIGALVIAGGSAIVGGTAGGLGGGWLGAAGGGALGLLGGIFKGAKKAKEKTPEQQVQDLRVAAAVSDGQVAQAEAYLAQQKAKSTGMTDIKQQRAEAQLAVANPDAPSNNAAKILANDVQVQSTMVVR